MDPLENQTEGVADDVQAGEVSAEQSQAEPEQTLEDVFESAFAGEDSTEDTGSNKQGGEVEGAAAPENKAAADVQGKQEASQEDDTPEDLKAPEGLGQKANERFQALANEVRERRAKDAEVAEITESYREIQRMAQDSCNNGEEVRQLFDYAKAVKTNDFDKAEFYLRQQIAQFEALSGRNLGGVLMQGFQDLQQRVENMEIDERTAREVAAARWQQNQMAQMQQQEAHAYQMQQQQMLMEQREREAAIQRIEQFSLTMAKNDLMWPQIEPRLTEYARKNLSKVHPSQWEGMLQSYYNGLKSAMRPDTNAATVNPLRGGNNGSNVSREPKDMMDVINITLGDQ